MTAASVQPSAVRRLLSFAVKLLLTAGAIYLLLTHPVRNNSGESVIALRAILDYLPQIDSRTFWYFAFTAFTVRACGIVSSMLRWSWLLRGQGIHFRGWHIVTTFLIGRFLGTFLPSTIGLDGYKLYDAARFSGRTVEATAATVIEKGVGIIGMFLCFLITLPLGYTILGERAALIAIVTVPVALLIIVMFFLIAFQPSIITAGLERLTPLQGGRVAGVLQRVNTAAAAYRGQKQLLIGAVLLSFLVHFCTAATYYFTAIAVGAKHAAFWEVGFASTIQIFATVMSPFTIAGEGVREIVQALLLAHRIGMEQSILSAALGFWAAEAPTLIGGFFYLGRKADYRPVVELMPLVNAERS
ncbi:MAG: flippase-like domain-containing protein [Deltaproteobacteria bacterium]|nr:flippase-like domain-containing protein [Deltaproteobacteria bacterium]